MIDPNLWKLTTEELCTLLEQLDALTARVILEIPRSRNRQSENEE